MVLSLDAPGSIVGANLMSFEESEPLDRDDLLFEPIVLDVSDFAVGDRSAMRPMLADSETLTVVSAAPAP
jgi:hypothetical protein